MTRKKSNVKALALAVTCAILAGGYSGLNPVYAGTLSASLKNGTVSGNTVSGSIVIEGYEIATALNNNLSNVSISSGGITLGALANNVQAITYTAGTSGASSTTTIDSDTIINGELAAKEKLTLSHANDDGSTTYGSLDYKEMGQLSQLLKNTTGNKTVIDAGDGSKVGGVEFNVGAVTGVKSINSGDSSAKFKVTEDDSNYTFRAGNFQVTTGKENGYLNGEITFADTNRPNKSDEITLSEIIATRNKTDVINNIKTSGDESYESTKIRDVLEVRSDGKVNIDGKLTAGSDSKIGNITISDGQLSTSYSGAEGGIARVNVTDLYDDHKIINENTNDTYSSKNVKLKIDSLEQSSTTIGSQIQKIERFTNQNDGRKGTSIAGNLDVYDDGTVIINYNQDQQVTIDSNGIKVGAGSAYINNDGFKAGADGKNSLTITGLTAKEIRAGNDNTEFFVDGGGNVVANGTLSAAGSKFFVSSDGDITARGFLSVAGDKFRVDADGSINANNKFIVGADGSLRASDDKFTADEDGNVRAIGSLSAAKDKFQVGPDGSINVNQKFIVDADGTISSEGTLSAAGGNFSVDADGNVTASGQLRSTKLAAGTNGDEFVVDADGNVVTKGNVTANKAGFNDLAVTNGLTVGDSDPNGKFVNIKDGAVVATGSITAMGDLAAVGNLYVNGQSTFTNGVKTNKIEEATTDAGVTVDGVLLKDGGISAADGKFTVDENGNVVAKGTLSAADGKFTVDADGAVSAAGGNFGVDKDGNTTVGGTLNVTGDTTLGGNLGVTGNATVGGTLNVTGDTTLGGNLGVTGNTTVGGTLNSKGNFSVGNNDEFTVDASNGDVVSKGKITSSSATIGTVGITDTGVITGVSSLTTDALIVNGALNINGDITGKTINGDSLAITGNGTIGGSLSVTGAITGATINGATITTDSFNGAKISSNKFNGVTLDTNGDISGKDINAAGKINGATITDNSFNGVTMSNGNVTGGTITGTTVTDGAGASMNAGTVTANKFTDGQGFTANSGNVNAKDVTATGTVIGTTLTDGVATMKGGKVTAQNGFEVDANNSLTSSGLKAANIDAAKATIGKIKIEGSKITSTEADGTVGLAGITVNAAGAVNNVTSIDGVAVAGSTASGLTVGSGATAVTIGGNSMALSSTNFGVDNDGDVTGQSFTAGSSYLKDGELKLNDANIWTTAEGIKAEKATIGANTLDSTGFSTTGTLGVAGKATFGSNAGDSTTIEQGAVSVTQNGKTTTIKGGEIETDKLTVNDIVLKNSMQDGSGNTITISGTDGSMSVASGAFAVDKEGQLTNKITGTEGGYTYATNLATSKSGINANYTNGVNGNNNLLTINKDGVALGVTDSTNQKLGGFAANEDNASLSYGDDNSIVVDETTITSALGSDVSTTLTNDGTDQSIISKVTDNATSTIKADSIEDKVGTAKRSLTEAEIVDDVAGMTVKTNADGTLFTNGTNSTLINGSKLTSTNGAATGVLDGSNLTLTDGNKSTTMEAGKVTFKSETAGEHGGTETTIDGGTITTDTLNVERINLGGELLDSNGNPAGGNLSMDKEGNFSAAGGNFKVTGGSGTDKGAMTNTVGNTTLKTDTTGAGMSYDNGSVKSNVSVGDNNANVSAGAGSIDVTNESITSKVGTDASSTITADSITDKVGGTTVETKDGSFSVKGNGGNGMNIDTNTGKTTFTGASGTTTIDGSTITTGKLITDELVITGQGDAAGDGKGSLAFGGNGTIKSDVKDGSDKNTQFTTDIDGVTTKVTDGTNTTTNEVAAAGNTNTVTNGTATSKNTQTATSIGGVITNGTVKIAQTLDGENGTITNEVTDKDGNSSKLEQNGTGLTYTDSANADNATRIDSKDVSIGSATDDSKRINLSDLGQIDDLDTELSARDEFKDNPTAVGGINAEAAARRADVARLDNRIDDVNERVDKVGAMAAAIASLKSIGYDPQAPSEFSVGLGQYKGETGVALGFFHYPNKNFMINVSLSTAGGETMGGIGATWRFGHKSPQKLLDEQREAQAKKELAAAEKYKAAAQLAKEAQERAEYAAKLARQAQVSADNAKAAADATQAKHLK